MRKHSPVGSCFHSISLSPKLPLEFLKLNRNTKQGFRVIITEHLYLKSILVILQGKVHIPGAATLFVKFDPRYATGQIAVTLNVMFYRIINPKQTLLRGFSGYAIVFTRNVDDDSFFVVGLYLLLHLQCACKVLSNIY